jgi:hypothetical protein
MAIGSRGSLDRGSNASRVASCAFGFRASVKPVLSWRPTSSVMKKSNRLPGEEAMDGRAVKSALKTCARAMVIALAAMAVSPAICPAQTGEPIKIGFSVSLTGGLASSGKAHLMSKHGCAGSHWLTGAQLFPCGGAKNPVFTGYL